MHAFLWLRATIYALSLSLTLTAQAEISPERQNQANKNNPEAQYQQALRYLENNTEKDFTEAFYWLQQAAEHHHQPAMEQLAEMYLNGIGTTQDTLQGLYWLTKLATTGNVQAQYKLGSTFASMKHSPLPIDMAQVWFHTASESSPQAEQAYASILQEKFNQQRAKQVSAITELDNSDPPTATVPDEAQTTTPYLGSNHYDLNPIIVFIALLLFAISTGYTVHIYQRKDSQLIDRASTKAAVDNEALIKRQKQQLEILYRELKRLKQEQIQNTTSQEYPLACAVFGYNPTQVPAEKSVKTRYKQLSKIYHPDTQGSDEEMKRLNSALTILLKEIKNR